MFLRRVYSARLRNRDMYVRNVYTAANIPCLCSIQYVKNILGMNCCTVVLYCTG